MKSFSTKEVSEDIDQCHEVISREHFHLKKNVFINYENVFLPYLSIISRAWW